MQAQWDQLLKDLEIEIAKVKREGNKLIPQFDFSELIELPDGNVAFPEHILDQIHQAGSAVIRNVIPKKEARNYKFELDEYLETNKEVLGDQRAMFQLFWTPTQLKARSHPNMIKLQKALMNVWHAKDQQSQQESLISVKTPIVYVDRFRIRQPGQDTILPPHIDGGFIGQTDMSVLKPYYQILENLDYNKYDPFDYSDRLQAFDVESTEALKRTALRLFQGWLSISSTGPGKGTLMLNPMIKLATAYVIMRPYFQSSPSADPLNEDVTKTWTYTGGKNVFDGLLIRHNLIEAFPHLRLEETMCSIPDVEPGDYVAWHCDGIHAVEEHHTGTEDSSVMYIGAAPMCVDNLNYVARQRLAFANRTNSPDFKSDSAVGNVNAGTEDDIQTQEGLQAMGMGSLPFDVSKATTKGERQILENANQLLFQAA